MKRNHFMAGRLCFFLSNANADPNRHTAFVSGQLEFRKNQDLRLLKHAVPVECGFCWHSGWVWAINQSEEASV